MYSYEKKVFQYSIRCLVPILQAIDDVVRRVFTANKYAHQYPTYSYTFSLWRWKIRAKMSARSGTTANTVGICLLNLANKFWRWVGNCIRKLITHLFLYITLCCNVSNNGNLVWSGYKKNVSASFIALNIVKADEGMKILRRSAINPSLLSSSR